ncbi:MAG: U32 family peptidase [Ruminococcus sp.]|nr:U32 family peptidase [Ruminococcus sp.]MDE7098459.1 U32 family peptidase [Ruminococcus sp.]
MKARFHLPDFAGHFKLNLVFVEFLRQCPQYFREGVEIASVYGAFPPSLWNGGRTQGGICDKTFIKSVIKNFNERGIPLRFTFTNPMLEKKHLDDNFCNMVMHLADNGMNEVIVFSPLLEDYIRKNYPNYKITSSTCKRITNQEQLCAEVEKDYHIVVIDYDLNHDFDTLKKISDKKKCELLVNACCNPNCQMRTEHYKVVGMQQIIYANHVKKYHDMPFNVEKLKKEHPEILKFDECPCTERSLFEMVNLKNHISPDEIWNTYIPMGFEQFKIEGRTAETLHLVEHYMYYMIKPECKDQARFEFLKWLSQNGVITIEE